MQVRGQSASLTLGRHELPLSRTLIMGVLNVTPDSFSDGGFFIDPHAAITHARAMAAEGADIIDVGGESTRPGAAPVPLEEELRRTLPVVEAIVSALDVPVSIDTVKPEVARRCLRAGATMVNDIQGLRDPAMLEAVAEANAAVTIMHMKGTPQTMANEAVYDDLIREVREFLATQAALAEEAGIQTVVVDPGIGFAKTGEHNLVILRRLGELATLDYPLLVGPSRKSFIGALTGMPADERLGGTVAAVTACVLNGANIVRVHDVGVCRQAVIVAEAIKRA